MTRTFPRAAVVAGIAAALVLALRAPIDVGPRDAGELGAAAATLGVSHPTGAPVAMLIAHVVTLLPLGSVAFRQSLAMAACTGLAVACGATIAIARARGLSRAIVAATVASIVLAPTILRAGTMMEVYAPSLALVALAWVAAERRALLALGALSGLALSAHVTARVLVPFVAIAPLVLAWKERRSPRAIVPALVAGLALAPMILEVPAAALRRPAIGWGDPRTPARFVRHFLASDIREAFAGRTTGGHRLDDLRAFFDVTLLDAGVPLLVLAAIGLGLAIAALARRPRELGIATVAACVALDGAYSAFVNPMGIVDRQVGHVALLGIAVLAARALEGLASSRAKIAVPIALGAVALGLLPRVRSEFAAGEAGFVAETWTIPGALARVPARAIVICDADDACGGSLYAQLVEGARPDVDVVPRPFLDRPTHLSQRLAGVRAAIDEAIATGSRALLVDAGGESTWPFALQSDAATPLVRARLPEAPGAPPPWPFAAPRLLALDRTICGDALDACTPLARHLLAQAHLGPIRAVVTERRLDDAEALARAATRLDERLAAAWNDLAVVHGDEGRFDDAIAELDRALALAPTRAAALGNRVLYLVATGRLAEARCAQASFAIRCGACLAARLYGAALDAREGRGRAPLDALADEAAAKGKRDAWCRAYEVGRLEPPTTCRAPR